MITASSSIVPFMTAVAQSPLLWIGATVFYLILAIWVGVGMPRRFHNIALWLPIALLAAMALRPYPVRSMHHAEQPEEQEPDEWHEVSAEIDLSRIARRSGQTDCE